MLKITSCFLYVLSTIIYTGYAKATSAWFGFGQITILLFICALGVFAMDRKPNTYSEKLFFEYVIAITGFRAVYTFACIFLEDGIIIFHTDLFSFIIRITSIIVLYNCAIKTNHPLK